MARRGNHNNNNNSGGNFVNNNPNPRNRFNYRNQRTKYNTGPQFNSNRQIRFNTDNRRYRSGRRNDFDGRRNDFNDRPFERDERTGRNRVWSRGNYRNVNYTPPRRGDTEMRNEDPDSQWFKVMIPHNKMTKEMTLQCIQSAADLTFTPYNYHSERGSTVFFVLGAHIAETLSGFSRRITSPNGLKLTIITTKSSMPNPQLNDELTETIKHAMSGRYNAEMKIMDLSKFRDDNSLQQLGLYVPLSRPNILNLVVKIIMENTPDVIGINLRDNKLSSLEPLIQLWHTCLSVKAIDLSNNQIRNLTELDFIKANELNEFALSGNPVCDTLEDQAAYISRIRTRFPKLTKLDGEELPPAIGFDVAEVSNLPAVQPSYLPDDIKQFIYSFFELYYNIYDSNDRQSLIQAYHDQAMFSLSISDTKTFQLPEKMRSESRNLLNIDGDKERNRRLKRGKHNIVSALCELPETKHEASSFVVDVPICNNLFIQVVVNGVYKEILKTRRQQPIRSFCRTFFIVPQGQGFVIVNDIFLVTIATVHQINKYNQSKTRETSSRDAVLEQFVSATGMKKTYAQKCLEENNFNYDVALSVFNDLRQQNAIPMDAFN